MLFNSILFLVFFAFVYVFYWAIPQGRRHWFLIPASLIFYAAWGLEREGLWGIRWTVHFLAIVVINHFLIHRMMRASRKKPYLISIILIDVLNLAIFKYFGFFRRILTDIGIPVPEFVENMDIFLPLAISFYTFQLLAYAVDVYRGIINEEIKAHRFYLFILFFPQLIAGPIMRSTDFLPQKPTLTTDKIYSGIWLILGGLVKKVLIADPLGTIVAPVFQEPQLYTAWSIMLAGMCFSLQVYCDFSGYTDIARGCARLLGYQIPENFLAPFFSKSARELWQRWHITLATWLRDYIYFPLGGNRISEFRTYINQVITFTLGGLWHGANYTYVAWGAMWGFLLAIERFVEHVLGIKTVPEKNRFLIVLKIFIMFIFFSFGALMFRAHAVEYEDRSYSAGYMMVQNFKGLAVNTPQAPSRNYNAAGGQSEDIYDIFGSQPFQLKEIKPADTIIFMFLAVMFFHWIQYKPEHFSWIRKYDFWLLLILSAVIGGIAIPALVQTTHQFIYFVF